MERGTRRPRPPTADPTIALPEDATGKAGDAIGYLHMNCGVSCHSNRGLGNDTGLLMRLRAEEIWPLAPATPPATPQQTDIYSKAVNSAPTTGAVAQHFPGTVRISPGSHDTSLIWILPHRRDLYQMPPLVSGASDCNCTLTQSALQTGSGTYTTSGSTPTTRTARRAASGLGQPSVVTRAPAIMSTTPSATFQVTGSRRKTAAIKTVRARLILSTGATRDAGPSCSARK
jgi:hypothetical protein